MGTEHLIVFSIGFLELFLGTINFKFTQKSRLMLSALSTFAHVYLWAYIIQTLFYDGAFPFLLVTSYAIGCGLGDYMALRYEPLIDKHIIRIQRRGRKIRRGKWFGKKK